MLILIYIIQGHLLHSPFNLKNLPPMVWDKHSASKNFELVCRKGFQHASNSRYWSGCVGEWFPQSLPASESSSSSKSSKSSRIHLWASSTSPLPLCCLLASTFKTSWYASPLSSSNELSGSSSFSSASCYQPSASVTSLLPSTVFELFNCIN